LISVDFDESCMEQTDEIAEYLRAIDDVLTYCNENGQIKHVCIKFLLNSYLISLQVIKKLAGNVVLSELFLS